MIYDEPQNAQFCFKTNQEISFLLLPYRLCVLHAAQRKIYKKSISFIVQKNPHPLSFKDEDHDHIVNLLANHPISAATNKP